MTMLSGPGTWLGEGPHIRAYFQTKTDPLPCLRDIFSDDEIGMYKVSCDKEGLEAYKALLEGIQTSNIVKYKPAADDWKSAEKEELEHVQETLEAYPGQN